MTLNKTAALKFAITHPVLSEQLVVIAESDATFVSELSAGVADWGAFAVAHQATVLALADQLVQAMKADASILPALVALVG